MEANWPLILEYLKLVFSWPLVVTLVTLLTTWRFSPELRGLINRIATLKAPGVELTTQPQTNALELSAKESGRLPTGGTPALPEATSQETSQSKEVSVEASDAVGIEDSVIVDLGDEDGESAEVQRLTQLLRSERADARLWEYRYLNHFLATHTQRVLTWLAARLPVSERHLDSEMMPFIVDPVERVAVVKALLMHHLVAITDGLIEVTPKGREYVDWRGPLPPQRFVSGADDFKT